MPVLQYGEDAWVVMHPAIAGEMNMDEFKNPMFQMSREFATFLFNWDSGDFGPSPHHTRNFFLATRKSCYKPPLLNELGMLTKAGEVVLAKAKTYNQQLRRYHESIGTLAPKWHECDTMDTIVYAGFFRSRHINFLKALYLAEEEHNGKRPTNLEIVTPTDLDYQFTVYENRPVMKTSPFRSYPQRRVEFEMMVKFGFIELVKLPKAPTDQSQRGRNPIGGLLTEMGRRFFEDFKKTYDPTLIKARQRFAEMPASMRDDD